MSNQVSWGHLESKGSTGIQVQTCFGRCHFRAVRMRKKEKMRQGKGHMEAVRCLLCWPLLHYKLLWDWAGHVVSVFIHHMKLFLKNLQGQTIPQSGPQHGERVRRICPSPPSFKSTESWLPIFLCCIIQSWWALRRPETASCSMAFRPQLTIRSDSTRMRASVRVWRPFWLITWARTV